LHRVLLPEGRELHAPLLEVDRAVTPVGEHHITAFPRHLVIGVYSWRGVDPLDTQRLLGLRARLARLVPGGVRHDRLFPSPVADDGESLTALKWTRNL